MRNFIFVASFMFIMSACNHSPIPYPVTREDNTVDTYFGTKVPDPYRWLENDTSAEVKAWVKAENKVTFDYLAKIPFRSGLQKRLTQIWNYERVTEPFKEGGRYFFFKNNGLQNQNVLYMLDKLGGDPKVALDPNLLSSDGTVALNTFAVSHNGKYLAYGVSQAGSDWVEVFVKDLDKGTDLSDHLKWVKFSGLAWFKNGFYYSRYDAPAAGAELTTQNTFQKLYYHTLGTDQSADALIYSHPKEGDRMYGAMVDDGESWLIMYEVKWGSQGNALWAKDLRKPGSNLHCIAEGFDHQNEVIDIDGDNAYLLTNNDAPRYKIMRMNLKSSGQPSWSDFVPQQKDVLETAVLSGGKIILQYMHDVKNVLKVYDLQGTYLYPIELPAIGTVGGFAGDKKDPVAFYSFTSFNYPSTIFQYDITKNSSTVWFAPKIDFKPSDYTVEQVFYKSKDSTVIPMFLVYRKDLKRDGTNPALLYGYGGFNITEKPTFRTSISVWLENGGVYALANIRGGGEYGEEWHEAGMKLKKQNVFDDFIAAAGYLINEKYTSSNRLAIMGGSNGGLLIGAVINQRPDLFRVAIPEVGVMDMLRYHKFTIGGSWVTDYGSSDDSVQFANLIKYSPLHNIRSGLNYPAVMVTTADHDDRVVPAHSFKYIATLQKKYEGPNPVLIRIQTKAGHGGGKPTTMAIEEMSDVFSFIFFTMGVTPVH